MTGRDEIVAHPDDPSSNGVRRCGPIGLEVPGAYEVEIPHPV